MNVAPVFVALFALPMSNAACVLAYVWLAYMSDLMGYGTPSDSTSGSDSLE